MGGGVAAASDRRGAWPQSEHDLAGTERHPKFACLKFAFKQQVAAMKPIDECFLADQ
jgi:hypothetical protein